MRMRSRTVGGYQVHAVAGTHTVSFAIDARGADTRGLLGFAVEREDPAEGERYFMQGFKVFESVLPLPAQYQVVSTFEHPVQSFVWDDFTAKPGRSYTYWFYPFKGAPKNLDRSARPIKLVVHTEPEFGRHDHDVFFNRGAAGSQAYARKFKNLPPDQQDTPAKCAEAFAWLARGLGDALLRFIAEARKGDALRGCFYEFCWRPAADALAAAMARGVDVQLVLDGKGNATVDKNGKPVPATPRDANRRMVADAGLPAAAVVWRTARSSAIAHNKFMVLLRGARRTPTAVWTGSTNLSVGAIHGQTNVGHWVRDGALAARFLQYWALLAGDPGGRDEDSRSVVLQKNKALRAAVQALGPAPASRDAIAPGITPVFSPRGSAALLELYAALVDEARRLSCITLAFGIADVFKQRLADNSDANALGFFLLEKREPAPAKADTTAIRLNAKNNVYMAWGSYLHDALHQWAQETSGFALGLAAHVAFIHSKFLLADPLGEDPIVVSGSANFSTASCSDNDENMIIVRGDKRTADIYFTEFNRLFNHYYVRSVLELLAAGKKEGSSGESLFLREDDSWLAKYKPGSLRWKRVQLMVDMKPD